MSPPASKNKITEGEGAIESYEPAIKPNSLWVKYVNGLKERDPGEYERIVGEYKRVQARYRARIESQY